jgi:hypothetical protein
MQGLVFGCWPLNRCWWIDEGWIFCSRRLVCLQLFLKSKETIGFVVCRLTVADDESKAGAQVWGGLFWETFKADGCSVADRDWNRDALMLGFLRIDPILPWGFGVGVEWWLVSFFWQGVFTGIQGLKFGTLFLGVLSLRDFGKARRNLIVRKEVCGKPLDYQELFTALHPLWIKTVVV